MVLHLRKLLQNNYRNEVHMWPTVSFVSALNPAIKLESAVKIELNLPMFCLVLYVLVLHSHR